MRSTDRRRHLSARRWSLREMDARRERTNDQCARLKGELDNLHIGICSSHLKHAEDVLPAGADVLRLSVDEMSDASDDHIANGG